MAQRDYVKIPFHLVTGFLGSGKTTLLKRFIRQYAGEKRIAVVQNEFSAMDVDGRELQRTGNDFELLEVNNGSVFCACLLGSFIPSLSAFIKKVQPEIVILEATGLADPINLAQVLESPHVADKIYLAHIWSVIDSSTFLTIEKQVSRISHQVRIADTVLINKMDMIDDVQPIKSRLTQLNPFASVIETEFCEINITSFASSFFYRQAEGKSAPRPNLQSAAIRSTRPISRQTLNSFLEKYEPLTWRIKGFINLVDKTTVAVQSCFGKTEIQQIQNYSGPTELVVMGNGLDAKQVSRDFREC